MDLNSQGYFLCKRPRGQILHLQRQVLKLDRKGCFKVRYIENILTNGHLHRKIEL